MRARLAATSVLPLLVMAVMAACTKTTASAANDSTNTAPATSTATAAAPTDTTAVRKSIEDVDAKWAAAEARGDANAVSANYADNVITMYSGRPTSQGRDAAAKSVADDFAKNKYSNVNFHTDNMLVSGDIAVENGTATSTRTPTAGKPVTHTERYMTVWQKQPDGSWKVARDADVADVNPATKPASAQ